MEFLTVYEQVDNKRYTREEIGQWDDVSKLFFVDDKDIIGIWKSVDFVDKPENFLPKEQIDIKPKLMIADMIAKPNGETIFEDKNGELNNDYKWTKGYIYRKNAAGAYTIKKQGKETFLFWQWKSGDYTYGHLKPHYYVFKKEY